MTVASVTLEVFLVVVFCSPKLFGFLDFSHNTIRKLWLEFFLDGKSYKKLLLSCGVDT